MQRHKLTATSVRSKRQRGMYNDGDGLYLRVTPSSTKSWIFRWRDDGKLRDMGLGAVDCTSLRTIGASLKRARADAEAVRAEVAAGSDPIEKRRQERRSKRAEAANAITFSECAARYIDSHAAGWKSAKHAAQWRNTLKTYADPVVGDLSPRDIDTHHLLRILEPIWVTKTETATRIRQRIESVLDWAKARGYRDGDNPARWRGHLDILLAKPAKVARVKHHPALPHDEIYNFMRQLADVGGVGARCLEFTILTAARTSEACGARWSEIDMKTGTWTVPGERIKSGREHRVPLSPAALSVLKGQQGLDEEFVFPGKSEGRPLSNMAMLKALRRLREGITVHGFRSTFRDWAADRTNYPREIAEAALSHALKDKTEAAYLRSDVFDKRRKLMNAWAKHCKTRPASNVVAIGGSRKGR